jgi:hypothetical protein
MTLARTMVCCKERTQGLEQVDEQPWCRKWNELVETKVKADVKSAPQVNQKYPLSGCPVFNYNSRTEVGKVKLGRSVLTASR